jgi:predicted  nucleic acid-binding Zn-ribbon protein
MLKKNIFVWMSVMALMIAGCATGKNYQGDIDSLNSRINTLQSESSGKDQEIARLQSQLSDQQRSLSQLEDEKRRLAEELETKAAAKSTKKPSFDSDLK